jgi:uncharacterized protein (TIGR02598 family)
MTSLSRSVKSVRGPSSLAAFSLVEVALAVGITAFAVVALLSLLPSGLSTFRSTLESSIGSQIAQRIFHDVQISDFSTLQSGYRYFDDQGREVFPGSGVTPPGLYVVRLTLSTNSGGVTGVSFLGNSSQNLARVTVDVAENRSGVPASFLFLSNSTVSITTYTTLVGRSR